MCIQYSPNNDEFGLVFPQESQNILSMTFAIPITEKDYKKQKIQSEFYFPSLQNNERQQQNLRFNGLNELSTEISNTEIKFSMIENFPYQFLENGNSSNIQSYFILNYVGEYKQFTDRFMGFIPIKPAKNKNLNSIFTEHEYTFIGFTPKFGNKQWLEE
jgi:hypothetical protein